MSRVDAVNAGESPVGSIDKSLAVAIAEGRKRNNLAATTAAEAFGSADITVVSVGLPLLERSAGQAIADLSGFEEAIATLGTHMRPDSLVIVASTVPPGTTAQVAAPALVDALKRRNLPAEAIHLAHSYERVMPGPHYIDSVRAYWRVYAGHTEAAANRCEAFLSKVIDVARFPLTRLSSTTASETAKLVENTYRAVTIAMMEEWGRFAEAVGLDMFEIADAIKLRPTHSNLRVPGFGVGGDCIPTDPLLAQAGAAQLLDHPELTFPFASAAVETNARMPLVSLFHVEDQLGGDLAGKRLLLLGVTYRAGVADTRNTPAATFMAEATARGATVDVVDPLIAYWPELDLEVTPALPSADSYDAVILAVAHEQYRHLDVVEWLGKARPVVFDAANVLPASARADLKSARVVFHTIGRGI
jgi:nucleotide sugar dehydrogenase